MTCSPAVSYELRGKGIFGRMENYYLGTKEWKYQVMEDQTQKYPCT
jgi:hypothetical protein